MSGLLELPLPNPECTRRTYWRCLSIHHYHGKFNAAPDIECASRRQGITKSFTRLDAPLFKPPPQSPPRYAPQFGARRRRQAARQARRARRMQLRLIQRIVESTGTGALLRRAAPLDTESSCGERPTPTCACTDSRARSRTALRRSPHSGMPALRQGVGGWGGH